MRKLLDAIIEKKLEEMDDAGVGSNKDIVEILTLSHKMTMEALDKELQLRKLEQSNIKTQTNIQINDGTGGGSNYGNLIEKILKGKEL
jgi:molybdenum cofactor biosynthesis enzyme